MNDVIIELKREREALRGRLAKIDTAIEEYERWALSVADLVGRGATPATHDPQIEYNDGPAPVAVFEEHVRRLLGEASSPLKRADVYDALKKADVKVGGKDPLNTVAARLSRMQGVTNLKGLGYWAEDRSYPPAGYPAASTSETGDVVGSETDGAAKDQSSMI